ncbi:PREDICTED: probable disease resistance protein At1g12280 [Tarenaya hassleriana]|uniref:probable disease resistance protein At1g12280 n=1 Tax=Tarenaya hassleriana TaxID=28532 RepID=UPI00053C7614|nr:PREDICTED: probable disease resistance protein At1g12280 [Tarenaya hassleriana]
MESQRNVRTLRDSANELRWKKSGVEEVVEAEENTTRKVRTAEVDHWLLDVQVTLSFVGDLLEQSEEQIQRSNSLCCCLSWRSTWPYATLVARLCGTVRDLISTGVFQEVTRPGPPFRLFIPVADIVGREHLLHQAFRKITMEGDNIVGIYGPGGVGKTEILKHFKQMFEEVLIGVLDIVIWADLSDGVPLQEIIGARLCLVDEEWQSQTVKQKANIISRNLERKQFALLIDDLRTGVDLQEIGLHNLTKRGGSKVVFTTHFVDVIRHMTANFEIEVPPLSLVAAWDIFKRGVGEIPITLHPEIPDLARAVAAECRGLPRALLMIGRIMSTKTTVGEWRLALDKLAMFSGAELEVEAALRRFASIFSEDTPASSSTKVMIFHYSGFLISLMGTELKGFFVLYRNDWIGRHGLRSRREERERKEAMSMAEGFQRFNTATRRTEKLNWRLKEANPKFRKPSTTRIVRLERWRRYLGAERIRTSANSAEKV